MKTTKKGFTLIELIVVIAIIGVLAAILVPTMLGYVKKSKISSANSSASSVYKAINSALTELDEEGVDVGGLWILRWDGSKWQADMTIKNALDATAGNGRFDQKVSNFFEDISKIKKAECAIKGGSCVALSLQQDSTYTGTYPGGIVTTDTYDAYSGDDYIKALKDAILVASGGKVAGAKSKTDHQMKVVDPAATDTTTGMTKPSDADYEKLYNNANDTSKASNLKTASSTPATE